MSGLASQAEAPVGPNLKVEPEEKEVSMVRAQRARVTVAKKERETGAAFPGPSRPAQGLGFRSKDT